MKNIGSFLLAGGFLAGAYATALDVQNVNWQLFAIAASAAIAGLVISKRQASAHARSDFVYSKVRALGVITETALVIKREGAP